MDRSSDWLRQSERDLESVRLILRDGFYEWACSISQADVLIVLSNSPHKRYFDRIPRYAVLFAQFDIPVDVFPYTSAELDRMQKKGNMFIQAMLDEGISLGEQLH